MRYRHFLTLGLGLLLFSAGCSCNQNNSSNPLGPSDPVAPVPTATAVTGGPTQVFTDTNPHVFTLAPSASVGMVGPAITFTASYSAATTVTFQLSPTDMYVNGTNQFLIVVGYNGTIKYSIGYIPKVGGQGTICYSNTASPNPYQTWTPETFTQNTYGNVSISIGANGTGYSHLGGLTSGTLNGTQIGYGSNNGAIFNGTNSVGLPSVGWFIAAYSPTGGDSSGAQLTINNISVTQ